MDFYSRSTTWQYLLLAYTLSQFKVQSQKTEKGRKCSVDTETTCLGSIPNVHNSDRCSLQPAKASPVKHCRSPLLPNPAACAGEGSELPPSSASVTRQGRACSKRGSPRRSRWAGRGRASSQGSVRGETAPEGGEEPRAPRRRLTSTKDPHGQLKARSPQLQRPLQRPMGSAGGPCRRTPPSPLGGLASRLGRGAPRCCSSRSGRRPTAGPVVGRGARRRGRGGGGQGSGGAGRRLDGVTCAPGRRVPHSRGGSSTQQHKMAGAPPRSVT